VNWRPGKLVLRDLLLPLLERTELVVVLVKVLEELFKCLSDVFIDPGSILEFDHEVKCVNH